MAIEETSGISKVSRWPETLGKFLPGVAFSAAVALSSMGLSAWFGGPTPLYAMVCGLVLSAFARREDLQAGFDLCTGPLLKFAIALLGTKIAFDEVVVLGAMPVLLIFASICAGLAGSAFAARRSGLGLEFGLIAGAAVAICGVSAALAAASLFKQSPEIRRDTLFTALTVTLLSTIAMVTYPSVGNWLGLDDIHTGLFLGATIHDLAQVVGAGYGVSPLAGDSAVVTKLVRVALLAPVICGVALISHQSANFKINFPWFIAFFGVAALWHSAGLLPKPLVEISNAVSGFTLLGAIVAIALKTQWKTLLNGEWRRFALIVAHTAVLAVATATILSISR